MRRFAAANICAGALELPMNRPSLRGPLGTLSMLLSAALLAACGALNPSAPQAPQPPILSAPPAPAIERTG